jgi:hypothetical protein
MENVFTDQRILDIIRNHFVLWAADMSEKDGGPWWRRR